MKTLKIKLIIILSVLALLFTGVAGAIMHNGQKSALAEVEEKPTLTIESNNVSYAESVYILYAVSNTGFDRTQNQIKMLFWEDVQEDYVIGTEKYVGTSKGVASVKGKSCVIFYSNGLAAKKMTDDIYARACVEIDGVAYYSDVMKYSVLDYVYEQKEKGGLTTTQINLYASLLNYGASAQYQLNYNIDRIANGDYFSITIVNGKLPDGFAHGRYKNNEIIKVKADNAPKGMKFSHWVDEKGIIISYDKHVEIELKGNKTYIAVYKDIATIATQLLLSSEIPYDGTVEDIDLPTAVSFEHNGETITLDVTWDTNSFVSNNIGEQSLYATLVDQSAYSKYDIAVDGIVMKVKTLPYTYEIDTNTGLYILTGYYGEDREITLPISYKNTYITTIASRAFDRKNTLVNVVIPNTYTKIESSAFFYCDSIEKMTIPFVGESATSSNSWFAYIFGANNYEVQYGFLPLALKEVTLLDSVTKVPDYAFYKCSQIEKFNLSNEITGLGSYSFDSCSFTEFTLPEKLTYMTSQPFRNCANLKRVNVASVDNLFSIGISGSIGAGSTGVFGGGADLYCNDKLITEISIPRTVKDIKPVLQNCTSIKTLYIPNTVSGVRRAFCEMTALEKVVFEEGSKIKDLYYAFSDCTSLTSINLEVLTELEDLYATFSGCKALKTITIPESVTDIGEAFYSTAIENITLPSNLQKIGSSAFNGCKSLTDITIPDSVVQISSYAFQTCSNLKNINLPIGLVSIEHDAFAGSGLTEITIPERVYNIDSYAFSNCSNLAKITILSERLTSITQGVFSDCSSLTSITIPDSVTTIGNYAFDYCSSLTSIIIPDSVTSIGNEAFRDCRSLTSIIIPDSVTSIGNYAFRYCSSLETIYCEAESQPSGWDSDWKSGCGAQVVWGYKGE